MPQPTTNNLEGWAKDFDKEFDFKWGENPKITNDKVKQFISDLRKHDMEELIKRLKSKIDHSNDDAGFGGEESVEGFNRALDESEQLIKEYYNK
jgi:hypothetical protein